MSRYVPAACAACDAVIVTVTVMCVLLQNPGTTFDDIGGLEDMKRELKEMVTFPVKHADLFERLGLVVSMLIPACPALHNHHLHADCACTVACDHGVALLSSPPPPTATKGCAHVWTSWLWQDAAGGSHGQRVRGELHGSGGLGPHQQNVRLQ